MHPKKSSLLCLYLILTVTTTLAANEFHSKADGIKIAIPFGKSYKDEVKKIIDVDTVQLTNGQRVKLIGISTINNTQARKEGIMFLSHLCKGKQVVFEYEDKRYDKKGRILAYMFLLDGLFINRELIANGYATIDFSDANFVKYRDIFIKLEKEKTNKPE